MRLELIKSEEYNHNGYGAGDGDIEKYEYECPCGKGRVIEEHDNTPGCRDHSTYILCEKCKKKYEIINPGRNWSIEKR